MESLASFAPLPSPSEGCEGVLFVPNLDTVRLTHIGKFRVLRNRG